MPRGSNSREGGVEELGGTEAGQAFAARNVNIAVDTHRASKSRQLSPAIQFPFFDFASHFHYF